MEQLLLKAATAATTDRGEFTAIAAAYTVDRVKDRIIPGAFKDTIGRWQASGKRIPLHWNHEGDAKSIIGSVDPASMKETDQGLYVEGRLDITDSETAREAWRSIKNNTMSLSFGYLIEKARKGQGGVTDLLALDLFEISIVPAPANSDTKILAVKALARDGISEEDVTAALAGDGSELTQDVKDRLADMAQRILDTTKGSAAVDRHDAEEPGEARSADSLRKESQRLELDVEGGLPAAPKSSGTHPWDDLRRESYRLMADVLSE